MPHHLSFRFAALAVAALGVHIPASAQTPATAAFCPQVGWQEGLIKYQAPDAAFPTEDTPVGAPDCAFHEWSWETFVWATALDSNGVPRFMTLPMEDDLLNADADAGAVRPRPCGSARVPRSATARPAHRRRRRHRRGRRQYDGRAQRLSGARRRCT